MLCYVGKLNISYQFMKRFINATKMLLNSFWLYNLAKQRKYSKYVIVPTFLWCKLSTKNRKSSMTSLQKNNHNVLMPHPTWNGNSRKKRKFPVFPSKDGYFSEDAIYKLYLLKSKNVIFWPKIGCQNPCTLCCVAIIPYYIFYGFCNIWVMPKMLISESIG